MLYYTMLIFVLALGVEVEDRSEEKVTWRKKDPSPTVGFADPSWEWLEKTTTLQTQKSEVRGGGVTEVFIPYNDFDEMEEAQQVLCDTLEHVTTDGMDCVFYHPTFVTAHIVAVFLQVVCVDWSELAGRGYVILNITQNLNCVS